MKIAVYSIALNESKFIERWYQSIKEADYILICDTGSTDNTEELCKKFGINFVKIKVSPWRFDDARNASLSLIQEDIDFCICLDMDEVMSEGWREELEKVSEKTTRVFYKFVWSWTTDGKEDIFFNSDKIHKRFGYRWKYPVHEVLTPTAPEFREFSKLEIYHYPDNTKSRGQYLPLLYQSSIEYPNDDRVAFYYARELFFYRQYEAAIKEFHRYLNIPSAVWKPERSAAMRYIAKCGEDPENWFIKACIEAPDRREPWMDLARFSHEKQDWSTCLWASEKVLSIKERQMEYLCEGSAWGHEPYFLAGISSWNKGNAEKAIEYFEESKQHSDQNNEFIDKIKEIYNQS